MSLGLHVCVLMRVGRKSLEGLELQGSNLRTMFEVQGWWRLRVLVFQCKVWRSA